MAKIYIVNHAMNGGGPYVESWTTYHHTEEEARKAYTECLQSLSEDPNLVSLVELDAETLGAMTLETWEGTSDDLDVLHEEGEDDDWIVEGKPDADL